MSTIHPIKRNVIQKIVLILFVAAIVFVYVRYTWTKIENEQISSALKIGRTIGASLSKENIQVLEAQSNDVEKPQYQELKNTLESIIRINKEARFAYVLIEKNGKVYFLADSEPKESKDYSPPGQEYVEVGPEDIQHFKDGMELMTKPFQDRWGRWRSVLIPLEDNVTNQTIALFGMDFNAKTWYNDLVFKVIQSSLIFILVLILLFLYKIWDRNTFLKNTNSELKQAQDALRESEEKYRIITQSTLDVIFIVDKFGKLLFFNESLVRFGYKVEELIGKSFTEVVPQSEWPNYLAQLKNIFLHQEVSNFFTKVYHKDGHLVEIEINGKMISHGGEYVGLGTIRDITERKRTEEEIQQKNEQLSKLVAEKDKFFSIIAHDLRSPFSSFLGLTEFMEEELPSLTKEEIHAYLQSLRNTASNLYRLLENLLNWASMQQGLIPFSPVKVQLHTAVDESIEILIEAAKGKEISILNNIPESTEVLADINMLQTVIRNLVSNAVKFTPKGGKVSLSAKDVENNGVEISIRDSGIGMNVKIIDNLFRLDVKTNRLGTEGEPSTGLGLLLCKEFVEKHGGEIWVKSQEGKGSVFYFSIPSNVIKEAK